MACMVVCGKLPGEIGHSYDMRRGKKGVTPTDKSAPAIVQAPQSQAMWRGKSGWD
jgi:hypothetical protein